MKKTILIFAAVFMAAAGASAQSQPRLFVWWVWGGPASCPSGYQQANMDLVKRHPDHVCSDVLRGHEWVGLRDGWLLFGRYTASWLFPIDGVDHDQVGRDGCPVLSGSEIDRISGLSPNDASSVLCQDTGQHPWLHLRKRDSDEQDGTCERGYSLLSAEAARNNLNYICPSTQPYIPPNYVLRLKGGASLRGIRPGYDGFETCTVSDSGDRMGTLFGVSGMRNDFPKPFRTSKAKALDSF